MYISPIERMEKIHLWLGNTAADEQAYFTYFQKDDEISPFAGDTGLDHAKISSIQNPLPHKSTTLENN